MGLRVALFCVILCFLWFNPPTCSAFFGVFGVFCGFLSTLAVLFFVFFAYFPLPFSLFFDIF